MIRRLGRHAISIAALTLTLAFGLLPRPTYGQGGNIGSNSSPVTNLNGAALSGVDIAICQPTTITSASVTGNLAVLTLSSNPQVLGFAPGMTILVSGFTGADTYLNAGTLTNGQIVGGFTILSVTPSTVIFSINHANATASSFGTVLQEGNAITPCGGLASIYSDPVLLTPVVQPMVSDALGNWNAFALAGVYYVQFYSPVTAVTLKQIVVSGGSLDIRPLNNLFTGGNNFIGGLNVNGQPVPIAPGPYTIGDCLGVGAIAPILSIADIGTCSGGGGAGTVVGSPRFQVGSYPTPGTVATIQGTPGINTDSTGNNEYISGSGYFSQNPTIDAIMFGARGVASPIATTVTCTATLNTATVGSNTGFQIGDGVVAYGCGATNTLPTPGAPTVTPSLASGAMETVRTVASAVGSTSYSYTIVARDKNGGLTAQSPAGTTSTGQAALGAVSFTNSNSVRSNNVVTVTTASPHNLPIGCGSTACPVVFEQGSTDASFSGLFVVTSVADSTHFTYTQGTDTRAGSPVNSSTGGTTTAYVSNHLVLPSLGGGYQYYIYKSGTLVGAARPGETTWDDYGVAAPTLPDFVPTSAPSLATNDYLATTITNIAGTTITLATTASNNSSSTVFKYDAGPTLLAAATAAATSGTAGALRIQSMSGGACLPINSHTILPTFITIQLAGCITLNETVEAGSGETWTGVMGGSSNCNPQFAWGTGRCVNVGTAYPGIAAANGNGTYRDITLVVPNQGLGMTLGPVSGGGFQNEFKHFGCTVGSGGADILGQCIVGYGSVNNIFDESSFIASGSSSFGYSTTPLVLFRNDIPNANGSNGIYFTGVFFTNRGMALDSTPAISQNNKISLEGVYSQGIRMPLVILSGMNQPSIYINRGANDTSTQAYVANVTQGMNATLISVDGLNAETGGVPGLVTGNPITGANINSTAANSGQNRDDFSFSSSKLLNIAGYSAGGTFPQAFADYRMGGTLHSISGEPWFFDLPAPTGLGCAVSAGGSVPVGTQNYNVTAVGPDGGMSAQSARVQCTTSSGNQTDTITWSPDTGATAYYVFRGNSQVVGCGNITTATCVDTSASTTGLSAPTDSGTGTTGWIPSLIYTPKLILTAPVSGAVSPMASVTFSGSANRTFALPDSSGTLCTTLSCPGTGTVTATGGPLVNNELVLGNGGVDTKVLPTASNANKVLHDGLPPAFGFVVLTTDVSGCLPIANGGTNDCSTIAAHQFFGNSTGSAAAPANTLIGTSDVTPNECATDVGAVNAYVINPSPAATALVNGLEVCFTPANNNTSTTPTLNVSGLGAQTIANPGGTALVTSQLTTLGVSVFRYNLAATKWEVQGSGGSGSGSGTVNPGSQFAIGQYPNAGTAAFVGPINAPAAPNGLPYTLVSIPAAGAAAQSVFALTGVPGRAVTSGCPDTILYTDRANLVTYAPSGACVVTLPQAGSANFGSNFITLLRVTTNQLVTVTPTTSTINGAATLILGINNFCFIYSIDNTNYLSNCTNGASSNPIVADSGAANAYVVSYPLVQVVSAAIPIGSTIFFTVTNANTTASTINVNAFGVKNLTKKGAAALTANDLVTTKVYVAFWDGTEWQLLNPSNGDLPTFTAHQFLGNNTASTTVGAPSLIGSSDVSPNWYAADSGAVNAYVIAPTPAITALTVGATAFFTTANANTGAATINVSSLGVKALDKKGATALVTGDILASPAIYMIVYDGTEWQVVNPSTGSGGGSGTVGNCSVAKSLAYYSVTGTVTACFSEADASQYQYIADSGAANAYVLTLAPALAVLNVGNFVTFTTTHTNTSASTVNVNGLGVKNITKDGTAALTGNEILSGVVYVLEWDGTEWQILNPSAAITANVVMKGSSDTSHGINSSITDNGTTVSTAEPIAVGASPPSCAGSGAGPGCFTEGTASTAVAGVDDIHADSTQKALEINNNNTGEMAISRSTCINATPVTVNANVTTDQNLMTCTLSANLLNVVGRTLHVHAAGIYTTAATSTAQITAKAKLCTVSGCGSGTVISLVSIQTVAIGSLTITNNNWNLDFYSVVQTAGASSAHEAHGQLVIDLGSLTTTADSIYADTNTATVGTIDSTAQLFLQITFAYSSASASNSVSQRQGIVELLN